MPVAVQFIAEGEFIAVNVSGIPHSSCVDELVADLSTLQVSCELERHLQCCTVNLHLALAVAKTFRTLHHVDDSSEAGIPPSPCSISLGLGILRACALAQDSANDGPITSVGNSYGIAGTPCHGTASIERKILTLDDEPVRRATWTAANCCMAAQVGLRPLVSGHLRYQTFRSC